MKAHLTKCSADASLPLVLREAARCGLLKLMKYYPKATDCHHLILATCTSYLLFCGHLPFTTFKTVLHPHLGFNWFSKLGSDRAAKAKAIFEHAFKEYQCRYEPQPPTTSNPPKRTPSANNFLDSVCLVDLESESISLPTPFMSELDRFLSIDASFGLGDRENPLLWWKVCFHCIFYLRPSHIE
jgi:hypothetical protein